ncbi:hypothetical protein HYFRA_00005555 [Hymenoscyphus fraxineus]|uniref:Uncharacterized protein n=1 Tax=Hymenoscyphus fraxineus TaxID=746836 RepID=A0A9N9KRN6_9HELO|nr:hypothetical protein HYFRA_00005555 [Hymenoscyphus fraxineus]
MIEETIDARYTLVQSVLEQQLESWFGKGNFKIIEPPDDYAKWKVEIPRKLEHVSDKFAQLGNFC